MSDDGRTMSDYEKTGPRGHDEFGWEHRIVAGESVSSGDRCTIGPDGRAYVANPHRLKGATIVASNSAREGEFVICRQEAMTQPPPIPRPIEVYARVKYSYTKSGGWTHAEDSVSVRLDYTNSDVHSSDPSAEVAEELENLSRLVRQRAAAEIARRNSEGVSDAPTSEIVAGDAHRFSDE